MKNREKKTLRQASDRGTHNLKREEPGARGDPCIWLGEEH